MESVRFSLALVLALLSLSSNSAEIGGIVPVPSSANYPIAFGKQLEVTLTLSSDEEDVSVIKRMDSVRWLNNNPSFSSIKVYDSDGALNKFPVIINSARKYATLKFILKPEKPNSLVNRVDIDYEYRGGVRTLSIPIEINGQCIGKDYLEQKCDPQVWTCQVDRNLYPILSVARDSQSQTSFQAIRSHDRTHRFSIDKYKIPFLQFIDAAGFGDVLTDRPSCEIEPFEFTKIKLTQTVSSFSWKQNPNAPLARLSGKTPFTSVEIRFPESLEGYSSVNGNTAEYRFKHEIDRAPELTIWAPDGTAIFEGEIECVLADGSMSVIRNVNAEEKVDAKPPKLHLIIEKQ